MKKLLLVSMMVLFPRLALAQAVGQGLEPFKDLGRVLNAVPCNASAAARTFTIPQGAGAGYSIASMQVDFVRSTANNVTMSCQTSQTSGASWANPQQCTFSAGLATCITFTFTHPVTASENWPFRLDFAGSSDFRCTVSCDGVTDTMTVYPRLTVR